MKNATLTCSRNCVRLFKYWRNKTGPHNRFYRGHTRLRRKIVRECKYVSPCYLLTNEPLTVSNIVDSAQASIQQELATIQQLSQVASNHPYYQFNYAWQRQIESSVREYLKHTNPSNKVQTFSILLCGWLGGFGKAEPGKLLSIEDVGAVMGVPVNVKDRDVFHLTIEEYLLALISLLEELARLARNSVTLGDYSRPLQISQFIKDVHAGFQILNLKNDALRKRSDGIKYKVKEVEDVVYDLSLRGLLPKA